MRDRALMLAIVVMTTVTLSGQDDPVTFRTGVTAVQVPVTVLDKKGKIVDGLAAADFAVIDGGLPQKFELDTAARPISMVVAVQSSSNMYDLMPTVRKASNLLPPLVAGAGGEIAVMSFDHRVQVLSPFSTDPTEIGAGFAQIKPGSSAHHLDDAAVEAIRMLSARGRDRKKILLLIGEGFDDGSSVTTADVLQRAEWDGVLVYVIGMPRQTTSKKTGLPPEALVPMPMGIIRTGTTDAQMGKYAPDVRDVYKVMKGLVAADAASAYANFTGGRREQFSNVKTLESALDKIGKEIHGQYFLTFTPQDRTSGYHEITVQVTQPKLEVRARRGYWLGSGPVPDQVR